MTRSKPRVSRSQFRTLKAVPPRLTVVLDCEDSRVLARPIRIVLCHKTLPQWLTWSGNIQTRETQKRLETVSPYTVQIDQKLHHARCSNRTLHGAAILHGSDHDTSRTIGDFLGCHSTV